MNLVMLGMRDHKSKLPLHITVIASGNASIKAKVLNFLTLPYIFPDIQSAKKLFRSNLMKNEINQIIAAKLILIQYLSTYYQHLIAAKIATI